MQCSDCDYCGQEESNIHIVYYCPMINEVLICFKSILKKYCDVQITNFLKLIFLETPKLHQKVKNTCISLIATYIVCMWNVRDKHMNTHAVIIYLKGEIVMKHRYIRYAVGDKFSSMVTQQYCVLDRIDI